MPPRNALKRQREGDEPSSKRLRFDDSVVAEAEQQAFDDSVAEGLEAPSRVTKRAVNVDGYDSDSTDDGEGVVLSRKSGGNEVADEDDDMFAPSGAAGKDKPGLDVDEDGEKKERFLELGEIEGQEFARTETGGGEEGEDEDEEPVDEDEVERKKKKGMGFELTSFNMKEEMEEGKFTEDGTFVRSADPHAMHDRWLEGTGEREIRKARKQKERRERVEREREERERREEERGKEELERELVGFMRRGESVLEALQRVGAEEKKKNKGKARKKAPKGPAATDAGMDTEMAVDAPAVEPTPIERITSLASALMSLGNLDIYEETYEGLLRSVRRSGIVPPDWAPPSHEPPASQNQNQSGSSADPPGTQYEYRWSPSYLATAGGDAQSQQTFGPYGRGELEAWRAAGYFGGVDADRVELRRKEGEDENWLSWAQLF